MPTKLLVTMHLEGSSVPDPEHLQAFGSSVFERGIPGNHHASVKAFSTGRFSSTDPGVWSLDLSVVDDRLVPEALMRLASGTRVFVGPLRGSVAGSPVVTAHRSWGELSRSPALSRVRFVFRTPVHFRSSQRSITEPEPAVMFRSLQRRWRHWSPDTALNIDLRSIVWSTQLRGESVVRTAPGRYDAGSSRRVANRITAWIGSLTMTIDRAATEERCILGALAQAAPFFGTGAYTTAGFGATDVAIDHASH